MYCSFAFIFFNNFLYIKTRKLKKNNIEIKIYFIYMSYLYLAACSLNICQCGYIDKQFVSSYIPKFIFHSTFPAYQVASIVLLFFQ